jgi:hypothetical protein
MDPHNFNLRAVYISEMCELQFRCRIIDLTPQARYDGNYS